MKGTKKGKCPKPKTKPLSFHLPITMFVVFLFFSPCFFMPMCFFPSNNEPYPTISRVCLFSNLRYWQKKRLYQKSSVFQRTHNISNADRVRPFMPLDKACCTTTLNTVYAIATQPSNFPFSETRRRQSKMKNSRKYAPSLDDELDIITPPVGQLRISHSEYACPVRSCFPISHHARNQICQSRDAIAKITKTVATESEHPSRSVHATFLKSSPNNFLKAPCCFCLSKMHSSSFNTPFL